MPDQARGTAAMRLPGDRIGPYVYEAESGIEPTLTAVVDTTTKIGFALGGGGTRGAFGVGALSYLTNVMHVGASVVSGTSVGSLSALKLAGSAPAMQGAAATQLLDEWTALQTESDMWTWEPWLLPLFDDPVFGPQIRDFVEEFLGVKRSRSLYQAPTFEFSTWTWGLATGAGQILAQIAYRLPGEISVVKDGLESGQITAFTNLQPTQQKTESGTTPGDVRANEKSGIVQLRMATVSLEKGVLRYVTGTGALLERDNLTPVYTIATRTEDPACEALVTKLEKEKDKVRAAGGKPEDVATSPEVMAAQSALGACRLAHPPVATAGPASVDIVSGAMASAAAPTFFPPQFLLGEHYVDGGIRELIPADVAFRCGADLVYAISESSLETSATEVTQLAIAPQRTSTVWNLPGIALRSLGDIALDEVAHGDVSGFGDAISVIAPSFNLFSGWLVDPGLISIWIDYGLMRTADVATYPHGVEDGRLVTGQRAIELSDHLTRLRIAAWLAEHVIANAPIPQIQVTHDHPGFLPRWRADGASVPLSSSEARDWVRCLRVLERGLISRREDLGLLAGRATSFLIGWERHPFNVPGPLWESSATVLRPAAAPPARRLLRDMGTGALFQLTSSGLFSPIATPAAASPPGTAAEVSAMPPNLIATLAAP